MINRRGTIYVELPEELRTKSLKDASIAISISVTTTKPMEKESAKAIEKFITEQFNDVGKNFKKFIRKRIEKLLKEDDE